jgi:pimeloyl-ACP methyl ester carboxylesterase
VHLSYDEAGTGGPAVVLIHGWAFGNRSHLMPQFEHLATSQRVLALDLPGHGASAPPPSSHFGFADCAAAIVGVLDEAGIDRAVLCGHSFGGRLAVEVAAAYPSRIAGAALLDPGILFAEPVRQQALRLVAALESEGWLKALEAYFTRLLSPYDPPELQSKVKRELAQVPREIAPQVMREGMGSDGADSVARVRCPLLVVHRAETPIDLERLRELQPEAWLGCVVGSGHWLTLAVPDQVNAMLDHFLQVKVNPTRAADGSEFL